MAKPSDSQPPQMPPDVAKLAADLVRAGHFATVEEVLRAGVSAVAEPAALPSDWTDFLRYRFDAGRAAFARGEAEPTMPDALMDGIETELGLK